MSLDSAKVERRIGIELYAKYSSFMLTMDINKVDFINLVVQFFKVEANSNAAPSTAPQATPVINTVKILTFSPLNPLNCSFSNALKCKRTFKETTKIKTVNLERGK